MTTEEQQQHQDTHQQSSGGDDDGVSVKKCLHCTLMQAIDDWIVEFNEKAGVPVCMNVVAQNIGAVIEDFLAKIRGSHGQAGVDSIVPSIQQGQMMQRAANAEHEAEPVEPKLNTKH